MSWFSQPNRVGVLWDNGSQFITSGGAGEDPWEELENQESPTDLSSQAHPGQYDYERLTCKDVCRMVLPLYTSLLCRSTAKHQVVDLGLLLVSRSKSWKKEMGMELKKAKVTWKLPSTCASLCPCIWLQEDFRINGCCFHFAFQMPCKLLFWPILTRNHTKKGILGNIVCFLSIGD